MPKLDASKLTDYQLYALFRNKKLGKYLRSLVGAEFELRNFSLDHRYELALQYELKKKSANRDLFFHEKVLIIIVPFFFIIQSIILSWRIGRGNEQGWRQHIRYMCIGIVIWMIAFLIFIGLTNFGQR